MANLGLNFKRAAGRPCAIAPEGDLCVNQDYILPGLGISTYGAASAIGRVGAHAHRRRYARSDLLFYHRKLRRLVRYLKVSDEFRRSARWNATCALRGMFEREPDE